MRSPASGSGPSPSAATSPSRTSTQPLGCSLPASSIVTTCAPRRSRSLTRRPRMGLALAGLRLAHEPGIGPELLDRLCVEVAHAAAKAADELGDDLGDRPAQRELHL